MRKEHIWWIVILALPLIAGIAFGQAERWEIPKVYSNGPPIRFFVSETNPVGVARIILSTNVHWTLVETKSSNYGCNVLGCRRDHSEMRIEREDIWIITRAEIVYEGRTNFLTLKCEPSLRSGSTRILYSGVDYERCQVTMMGYGWGPTNYSFR